MNNERPPFQYSQQRVACPSCGSARALAPFADKPGGYCHNEQRVVVPDDAAPTAPAVQPVKERGRKLAAVYDYTDENGARLYSVDRYIVERLDGSGVWKPGKTFVQRPHGADGARTGGMRGVRRVLYNLPAVVQAIAHGWPVVLCEGERDADTYNALFAATGFDAVATTSAQGAKGWTKYAAGYVESLRDARLILDGDCDASGVAYMRSIAESVADVVADLRVTAEAGAALAGVYGDGPKDITDRIAAGLTREAAIERLRQACPLPAPPIAPAVTPVTVVTPVTAVTRKFDVLDTVSAAALHVAEFEEPEWVVPDLLPVGLAILAGRPKAGKSWLALNIALAVATGGRVLGTYDTVKAESLYLALEDRPRRLQTRMRQLSDAERVAPPNGLHFKTDFPRFDAGGFDALHQYLTARPETRFVVIDTLQRLRGEKGRRQDTYAGDYAEMGELQSIALTYSVALLVVHHTTKATFSDPFDSISGTSAVAGSADTLMVLARAEGMNGTALYVRGRDVDDAQVAVKLDKTTGVWSAYGDVATARLSEQRRAVLDLLADGETMTPKEIAEAIEASPEATRKLLRRMVESGDVASSARGKYRLPVTTVTPVTTVRGVTESRVDEEPEDPIVEEFTL